VFVVLDVLCIVVRVVRVFFGAINDLGAYIIWGSIDILGDVVL